MTQPQITLTANGLSVLLDPDLRWSDEFAWFAAEQRIERSISGALIVDVGYREEAGRPITLTNPDDAAAWLPRATLDALTTWEAARSIEAMTLSLRGVDWQVVFRRHDGAPIEATPVVFVADPQPGEIGDWYLVTLRFMVI